MFSDLKLINPMQNITTVPTQMALKLNKYLYVLSSILPTIIELKTPKSTKMLPSILTCVDVKFRAVKNGFNTTPIPEKTPSNAL